MYDARIPFSTHKLPCLGRFTDFTFETSIVEWVNQLKLASWWHVPVIVHVTILQFRSKIERELSNLKEI